MPLSDEVLDAIATAWAAADGEALRSLGEAAGLALSLEALGPIAARLRGKLGHRVVLRVMADALASPHGIGLRAVESERVFGREHCLAVRSDGRITVGVASANNSQTKIGELWPALKPWYRDDARNRERAAGWAATAAADRVSLALLDSAGAPAAPDDREALWREILAHPDDDRPRLVLADRLTEMGDAHGELIALSIAQAALDDEARKAAQVRIDALVRDHGARIAGEVADLAVGYSFERGLVAMVVMTAGAFRKHGERLLSTQPIRTLMLDKPTSEQVAKLAEAPALGRVRALRIERWPGQEREVDLGPLARSPHLARLESLSLMGLRARPAEWEAVFAGLRAPCLTTITLSGAPPAALVGLARAAELPALATLELSSFEGDPEELARALGELGRSSLRGRLRVVALRQVRGLGAEGLRALFCGGLALESLSATHCRLDDAAVRALAEAPAARRLRTISLVRNEVTEAGVLALLALPSLEELDVGQNPVASPAIEVAVAALPPEAPLARVRDTVPDFPPDDMRARFRFTEKVIRR